jgi:hypothetical protein
MPRPRRFVAGSVLALLAICLLVACRPWGRGRDAAGCIVGENLVGGIAEPAALERVIPVRKKAWEAALGGERAARPSVLARLVGWPAPAPRVDGRALPADDSAFAWQVARDTWRGLEGLTDRENRLPIDHVHLEPLDPDVPAVGDYTSVATVGLVMTALVGATELGLVGRAEAVARLTALFDTLERLETHAGLFFNYYDTTSLERTSNLLSFVDTAWLTAGLLVVRQTFPELAPRATALVDRGDWRLFYDPAAGLMYHGWWVKPGGPSRYHYGVLYAESRLGSLIAIGKGDAPEAHWFRMARTFPEACDWQTQAPRHRHEKTVRGHTFFGGYYEWRDVDYVPSWGGSMFEALMPALFLDEALHAPQSLGANARAHVAVQRRYATGDLGYPAWGLSPSLRPASDGYGEYGVRALGMIGYPIGALAPYASALALVVEPAAALANLRTLAKRWDAWGDWGFYDAVDPSSGAVARSYLTLDQAMTFIALANHLCGGCLQQRFAADPIVARALPIIGAERFFD